MLATCVTSSGKCVVIIIHLICCFQIQTRIARWYFSCFFILLFRARTSRFDLERVCFSALHSQKPFFWTCLHRGIIGERHWKLDKLSHLNRCQIHAGVRGCRVFFSSFVFWKPSFDLFVFFFRLLLESSLHKSHGACVIRRRLSKKKFLLLVRHSLVGQ